MCIYEIFSILWQIIIVIFIITGNLRIYTGWAENIYREFKSGKAEQGFLAWR